MITNQPDKIVRLVCPKCNKLVQVDPDLADIPTKCPRCGQGELERFPKTKTEVITK